MIFVGSNLTRFLHKAGCIPLEKINLRVAAILTNYVMGLRANCSFTFKLSYFSESTTEGKKVRRMDS